MKKVKLGGIAIMVSVLLLGVSVNMAKAEEAVDTYVADAEGEAGTVSNTDNVLTSLSLGDADQNETGWNYTAGTRTLSITDDVTVEGSTEKLISSDGDLTITVANGATLTVKNNNTTASMPCGIYAGGDINLTGAGTINVVTASGQSVYGIYAGKSITISNIHLSVKCATNYQAIRAYAGSLTIDNANVYATGECLAGTSGSCSVSILGNSVVNIESKAYENSAYGLRGSEYTFSDEAHVKISSSSRPIGNAKGLGLNDKSAPKYYWRASNTALFTDGEVTSCSNLSVNECIKANYFEYIGSAHTSDKFVSNGNGKHSKNCLCSNPTAIIFDCSGGEATCTQRAICSVCHEEYGEQATNHNFEKHICTKCGEVESGVAVTVTAGSEKRGYMKAEIDDAITYAESQPGSVVKLLPDWSAYTITIDYADADFTIDLNGKNMSNGVNVNAGTVTIKDSSENSSGKIWSITIGAKGTVSLESGTVDGNVAVEGGVFNVDGGTIATIYFDVEGGQINWNSTDASVTNMIVCRTESGRMMEMTQVPNSPLTVKLDGNYDLSQPFASVKSGITLPDNIFSIGLWFDAHGTKYNLETEMKGSQLFARFPLNQTNSEDQLDIELDASSYVYDGSAKEPKVTVTRKVLQKYTDGSPSDMKDETLQMDGDYTVTYSDNTNAGTAKATIKGIGCYTGSVEKTFTIKKATWKTDVVNVDMSDRTYSCRTDNADQVDLTPYLPKNCGTVTAVVAISGDLRYSIAPKVTDGVLSFTTQQSTAAQTGTITVTVSTTNYEDFTITVPITTKDLGIVHLKDGSNVALVNDILTEGEKLSKLTFKDVTFVDEDGKEVAGTLSWQTPDAVPTLGTTGAQWVFQPKDADRYAPLSGSVAITVQKKSTSGSGSSSGGSGSGGSSSSGSSSGGGSAITDSRTDDTKKDDSSKSDTKQDETKPDDTKKDDTKADDKTDDSKNDDKKQDVKTPASKGTRLKTTSGVSYQVTSGSTKTPTVAFRAAQKKAKGTVTIPKTVTIDGVKYKVTSIASRAFAGNKNVKKIVVPSTITSISKNAFADCAKLTTITINTTKLNSKNVAKGAFDNIKNKTVIQVPKSMLAKYKKLFAKKGLRKKVKIVAIKSKKK